MCNLQLSIVCLSLSLSLPVCSEYQLQNIPSSAFPFVSALNFNSRGAKRLRLRLADGRICQEVSSEDRRRRREDKFENLPAAICKTGNGGGKISLSDQSIRLSV